MATVWQKPYMAEGSMADTQRGYMNTLQSAYGPGSTMNPCKPQHCPSTQYCPDQALRSAPCGYNGIMTNCPKNSMMDWHITGHDNAIYAVLGGSLWPWLEDPTSACGSNVAYGSCYEYAPKLLGCCASLSGPNQGLMSLPGLNTARTGAGSSIAEAYGFNAEAAAAANMGVGNWSRMQKTIPPRNLQEPCSGSFLR